MSHYSILFVDFIVGFLPSVGVVPVLSLIIMNCLSSSVLSFVHFQFRIVITSI